MDQDLQCIALYLCADRGWTIGSAIAKSVSNEVSQCSTQELLFCFQMSMALVNQPDAAVLCGRLLTDLAHYDLTVRK